MQTINYSAQAQFAVSCNLTFTKTKGGSNLTCHGNNKNKMSHLRNRYINSSASVLMPKRKALPNSRPSQQDRPNLHNATTSSLIGKPHHKTRPSTGQETDFNRSVHLFRDIFNSNDKSQLPFMASLRRHPRNKQAPQATVQSAFEGASKPTCSQAVRKRVSDFKYMNQRMTTSYYRWHNQSGRNSLWGTDFECSLRTYHSKNTNNGNPEETGYYSFIKPIVYKDNEKRVYRPQDMTCDRHRRSFSLK